MASTAPSKGPQLLTKVRVAIIVVIVVAAASAGYFYYAQPAAQAPTEIRIGAVLPLTGGNSYEGALFKTGYEIATSQVNAGGGIFVKEFNKKMPVNLKIYDDESKEANSVRLLEQLITVDRVDALLGGYSTPLVLAQVAVPAKYSIPYVNGGGASTPIYMSQNGTRRSPWVFGLLALIRDLSHNTLDMLKSQIDGGVLPKPLKIAMVWMNNAHGKDYELGALDKVKEFQGYFNIILDEPFDFNAKDFTSLLLRVKTANPDVFLCDCFVQHFLPMHREYVEQGLYGMSGVVSYGARGVEQVAVQQFKEKANYLVAAVWWSDALPFTQVKSFMDAWNKASKSAPDWYGAFGYETAMTLYNAIENAGTLDKSKVRDAIQSVDLKNAIVPGQDVSFDKNGLCKCGGFVIVQNLPDGKVALVWPGNIATGKLKLISKAP